MFILEFALTFRFEMVPNMRTPIHYATLVAIGNQFEGRELASLPLVLGAYVGVDTVLISSMMMRIYRMDLCFNGKD